MGGAIAAPLLVIILLLLVALVCVTRRSGKKNKHEITMQRNELYTESKFSGESQMQPSMASSSYDDNIYDTVDISYYVDLENKSCH